MNINPPGSTSVRSLWYKPISIVEAPSRPRLRPNQFSTPDWFDDVKPRPLLQSYITWLKGAIDVSEVAAFNESPVSFDSLGSQAAPRFELMNKYLFS